MDKWDWHTPDEEQFDALLTESATELPPDEMVRGVNPWRKAVNSILWGFGLITVTLNFWGLQYILPFLGYLLLLQGFRALRQENSWFRVCWLITVPRLILQIFQLSVQATILQELRSFELFKNVLVWIGVILALLHYVFFWNALSMVQQKAGIDPHYGVIIGLVFWYLVMCLLAFAEYVGFLLVTGMIVIYLLILRFLYKLSKGLDEVGYDVHPAKVRVPTWLINGVLVACLLAGIFCGNFFFSRFPMDWQKQEQNDDPVLTGIRNQLLEKGFPAEVLADLTEEDLRECWNAEAVVVQVEELPMNEGRQVREQIGDTMHYSTVYDEKELLFTHVAVQLEGNRWKMIHHFQWTGDDKFPGTEAIYADIFSGWIMEGKSNEENAVVISSETSSGQVLYDQNEETFAAPYFALEKHQHYQSKTLNFISVGPENNKVLGDFSFPARSTRQRGYIAYEGYMNNSESIYFSAWVTYVHQKSRWIYPASTASSRISGGTYSNNGPFKDGQTALQFKIKEYNE